jgi:hypothetical protein
MLHRRNAAAALRISGGERIRRPDAGAASSRLTSGTGAAMDIHSKPIRERITWLFDLARRHSAEYSGAEASLARRRYLALHPTAIMVLKCMDGRINIPVATNTPIGIIQPFRNLGGMFNLGWPHLGEVLTAHVNEVVAAGRRALVLITYHYSSGDATRGCAGFNHDTEAAIAHTQSVKAQVEHTFGTGHGIVYPIVCGFETDEDALVLHGVGGNTLHLAHVWRAGAFPTMASCCSRRPPTRRPASIARGRSSSRASCRSSRRT